MNSCYKAAPVVDPSWPPKAGQERLTPPQDFVPDQDGPSCLLCLPSLEHCTGEAINPEGSQAEPHQGVADFAGGAGVQRSLVTDASATFTSPMVIANTLGGKRGQSGTKSNYRCAAHWGSAGCQLPVALSSRAVCCSPGRSDWPHAGRAAPTPLLSMQVSLLMGHSQPGPSQPLSHTQAPLEQRPRSAT